MKIEMELITPSNAAAILTANKSNRRIKERHVSFLVSEILEGRWHSNTGESIKIATDGTLIDGQHRLSAIVKSNKALNILVCRDMDKEVFSVIDTGISRDAKDVFKMSNVKNEIGVTASLKKYIDFKNGHSTSKGSAKISNQNLLDFYNKNEKYYQSVWNESQKNYNAFAKIISTSTICAFSLLFNDISKKDSEDFFNQLCSGINITNPTIFVLRTRLMKNKMSASKLRDSVVNAYIIKSWNAFRKGSEIKIMKFDVVTEDFPIAI